MFVNGDDAVTGRNTLAHVLCLALLCNAPCYRNLSLSNHRVHPRVCVSPCLNQLFYLLYSTLVQIL